MQITKEEIETVKRSNELLSVIESRGIQLKKKGKSYVALCPFHKEKTPSFTVDPVKQLWNCFGCSKNGNGSSGGDVIGFVVKFDKLTFPKAIEKLGGQKAVGSRKKGVSSKKEKTPQPETRNTDPATRTPKQQKLLKRVIDFYHTTFTEDDRGLKYLTGKRKITDKNIFRDFKVGFANGTLLNAIPDEGEIIKDLQDIGILTEKKKELFYQCVTFPIFDLNGEPVGLYGRKIREQEVNHLYLPGPRQGVFNWQTVKAHKEIILTESIIDALSLYDRGFKNTVPCYGTNGLTGHHLSLFKEHRVKAVYIAFDGDDPGEKGIKGIEEILNPHGIKTFPVRLPKGKDINDYFKRYKPEEFEDLLKDANPVSTQRSAVTIKTEERDYEKTDTGFTVTYGTRKYQVMGLSKSKTQLKATLKAMRKIEGKNSFHIDTMDFYSARSRLFMVKALVNLFAEEESIINDDLNHLLERIQFLEKEPSSQEKKVTISAKEETEALAFLKNPNLLEEVLKDFENIGYTGEGNNKLMGYIAAISRKLDEPLSLLIQSRSAAGKSTLQDAILTFVPDEEFIKYTRITGQALFYKEEDSMVHKLLAIEEEEGARDATYSLRAIQSSKYLSIASTGKDPATGKQRTEEYKVKGPVGVFVTTTQVDLDYETASRFIHVTIDESREATENIHKKQREADTLDGLLKSMDKERVSRKHHNAQRLLRPLKVVNPYSPHLTFTNETLRTRRDHKKYLNMIKAVAYLHQYQREIKTVTHNGQPIRYIEVTLKDIERANAMANAILGQSLNELAPPSRNLLKLIREMVLGWSKKDKREGEYRFNRKDIREWSKWSDYQVRIHIKQLEELGYIHPFTGKRGKEYSYELKYNGQGENGTPFLMGLMDIKELKKKIKK